MKKMIFVLLLIVFSCQNTNKLYYKTPHKRQKSIERKLNKDTKKLNRLRRGKFNLKYHLFFLS